jgi:putative phosphoribosyl transferase
MTYRDRRAAGVALAACLDRYGGRADAVVLGLVRGGVPVAAEVARRLDLTLDVLTVRKLGVPWAPEVAFGAVGPGGVKVLNDDIAARLDPSSVRAVVHREEVELERRERRYRLGRPPLTLAGCLAILVDDGLATGASARAAIAVAGGLGAREVTFAAPVGSREAVTRLRRIADEVVCPLVPVPFGAVSRYYDDFGQVGESEVIRLLAAARDARTDQAR